MDLEASIPVNEYRVRRSEVRVKQGLVATLLGVAALVCVAHYVQTPAAPAPGFAAGPFVGQRPPAAPPSTFLDAAVPQAPERFDYFAKGKLTQAGNRDRTGSARMVDSFVQAAVLKGRGPGEAAPKITLSDVQTCIESWAKNAEARNIDATVGMYDPEMGRLLGTVDEAESPRRDTIPLIREYFNGFLGGHQAVKPMFPKFDEKDVFFLGEDTAVYSGYYKFALTKNDATKEVYAKFSYIVRKTPEYGVKIVTHNSGITPTGAVIEDSKITLEDVETCIGTWAKNAKARDIDATVGMYDPEMGRLLGTVDEAGSPRRDTIHKIREYFDGFLGGHQAVEPMFPKFDKEDVFFLSENTAVYSGYYKFALTKNDVTKEVYAKFSYIVRKTPEYGVKIVTHNSGITPTGAVEQDAEITLSDVETCIGTWAKNAEARDIEATVGMYDPEMGRLLGTVDEAESPRRDTIPKIREYFKGFLGGHQAVKPMFPKFDESDVFFLSENTAVYSGYYKFALTKEDKTKEVYAKFSYIVRKTPEHGVKIVTHNSGITPTGAVEQDSDKAMATA